MAELCVNYDRRSQLSCDHRVCQHSLHRFKHGESLDDIAVEAHERCSAARLYETRRTGDGQVNGDVAATGNILEPICQTG